MPVTTSPVLTPIRSDERGAVVPGQLLVESRDLFPDAGCRAHRPEGVVLVHDRDAEDGQHGVADELLHRPAVALDHRLRRFEVASERGAQALRIEALAERVEPVTSHWSTVTVLRCSRAAAPRRAARAGVAEPRALAVLRAAGRPPRAGYSR